MQGGRKRCRGLIICLEERGWGVLGGVVVLGVWGGEWGVAREAEKEDWRDRKTNHEIMRVSK